MRRGRQSFLARSNRDHGNDTREREKNGNCRAIDDDKLFVWKIIETNCSIVSSEWVTNQCTRNKMRNFCLQPCKQEIKFRNQRIFFSFASFPPPPSPGSQLSREKWRCWKIKDGEERLKSYRCRNFRLKRPQERRKAKVSCWATKEGSLCSNSATFEPR